MSLVILALAIALVCGWACLQLFRHLPKKAAALLSACLLAGAIGIPGLLLGAVATEPKRVDVRELGYETSNSCVKCHPDHLRSWADSYHSSMTQEASASAVLGDFDDAVIRYKGFEARMFRDGEGYYMDLVDPKWERAHVKGETWAQSDEQRRTFRVDRTVGSHIEQVYLSRLDNGAYFTLPFVWNATDGEWLPINAIFVSLEAETTHPAGYAQVWNSSCVFCHNTRPNPGLRPGASPANASWDVQLHEIGIACEACHGPGEAHVAANHNLMRRQLLIETGRRDRTIVNAARMKKLRSVRTCGRCHGKWAAHKELTTQVLEEGELFIPGRKDLDELFELPVPYPGSPDVPPDPNYFWPDGTPRPTAMEYQGVLVSPCFERGEMTCVSCHSMHASDPSDQLRFRDDTSTPEHEGDEQCTQCHPQLASEAAQVAHTRHEVESDGSRCVSCHMPYQSYGLLSAQRSHRIQNPDPAVSARTGLPNACNSCHVDRSLRWTADTMAGWRGEELSPAESELYEGDRSHLSEAIVQLVRGHALSRAIAVQMLGREDARVAAPGMWRVPFLIDSMSDPYPAVRKNAHRSLRRQPGFEDAAFDYVAQPSERELQIAALRERWQAMAPEHADAVPSEIPIATDGLMETATLERLRASRDTTELILAE